MNSVVNPLSGWVMGFAEIRGEKLGSRYGGTNDEPKSLLPDCFSGHKIYQKCFFGRGSTQHPAGEAHVLTSQTSLYFFVASLWRRVNDIELLKRTTAAEFSFFTVTSPHVTASGGFCNADH